MSSAAVNKTEMSCLLGAYILVGETDHVGEK